MRTLLALVLVSMVAIGAAQDIAKSTRIVAWTMWLCHQPKAITLTIWSIECHGDVSPTITRDRLTGRRAFKVVFAMRQADSLPVAELLD